MNHLPVRGLVVWCVSAASVASYAGPPIPPNHPDAIVDLTSEEGTALVKAEWRYHDAAIIEVDHHSVGPDLKPSGPPNPERFCDAALAALNVSVCLRDEGIKRIPKTGPLLIVANHPFGVLEGLVLESLVCRARPDVKVLSNYLLARIPEVRGSSIFVDPFGGENAARRNFGPLREAVNWLKSGGAMIAFPAGEVAHFKLSAARIVEPSWNENLARIARRTEAAVLPVFFEGCNSLWFQLLGLVHRRLGTALLPRELMRKRS